MALSCPECGLALSRSVNGGQCPLCERKDPSTETTASEVDLSEHTTPSARAPAPVTDFSTTAPGTPAPAPPRRTAPAPLSAFLAAVDTPGTPSRAPSAPTPVAPKPVAATQPSRQKSAAVAPAAAAKAVPPPLPVAKAPAPPPLPPPARAPAATSVPIPGVSYVRPAPPPPPAPVAPPPQQPQPTNPFGPQPLPAPAAFSAVVSAIPAPPPLFTATEVAVPEAPPAAAAAPPMSAAFEPVAPPLSALRDSDFLVADIETTAIVDVGGSLPPADAEPVERMELETSGGAPRDAAPETAAEERATAPSMPDLLPGRSDIADVAIELELPRAPERPRMDRGTERPAPVPASTTAAVPVRPAASQTAVPAPGTVAPVLPLAAAVPARRGIAPSLAAAGIALGLLFGFFAGRFSAPSAPPHEPTRVAATPVPTLPLYPVAVASPVTTPPAVESGVPSGTPDTVAATTAAPSATPAAVAALATAAPKAEPRPSGTARRALVGTVADALALESAGKSEAAAGVLEALVKEEPANAEAHWALALSYRAKKKGPKACREFRAYVKNVPDGENAVEAKRHLDVCRAVTLLDQEKIPEATAAFAEIVRANWTFPDGHYWLGTMQSLNNENAAACASFKSYLRLDAKGPYVDRATAQLAALGC